MENKGSNVFVSRPGESKPVESQVSQTAETSTSYVARPQAGAVQRPAAPQTPPSGESKKKKSPLKIILIIIAIIVVLFILLALFGDDSDTGSDTSLTDGYSSYNSDSDNAGRDITYGDVAYEVKDPVGIYRSFSQSKAVDLSSEEIAELAGGKHFVDQSFDFTKYASTINDAHEGTWGIYVYMCGSDLESDGGAATGDIQEILSASIPDGSTVVLQTGGANQWMMDQVDSNYTQRLTYDGNSLEVIDSLPVVSMGSQSTLEDFLSYCKNNVAADNEMVIFWNHGGGSLGGACYDEISDDDHLTLNEIDGAFSNVYGKERIEVVGFDCCLMASLDTAELLRDHAKMLVASEELEPGNGWYYTDWLNDLSYKPSMSNAELGKSICDSFMGGCQMYGTDAEATLSAIDLTQVNLVTASVNSFGIEILDKAMENPETLTKLGRAAQSAESYGGNTESTGYFDMVDYGDLLDQTGDLFKITKDYANYALKQAVVYNVHGYYRSKSTGIAVYYPYDKSEFSQQRYEAVAASDIYASAVRYAFSGDFSQEASDLVNMYQAKAGEITAEYTGAGDSTSTQNDKATDDYTDDSDDYQEDEYESDDYAEDYFDYYGEGSKSMAAMTRAAAGATISVEGLNDSSNRLEFTNNGEDLKLTIDDEGYLGTSIGENIDAVESIISELLLYNEEENRYVLLGTDNDIQIDWETGDIRDNFRGVWLSLGGHQVFMDIVYEGDDYNLYSIPLNLNGKPMDMSVTYDYKTDTYTMMGLTESVDTEANNQHAQRGTVMPKSGDEITLIGYYLDEEVMDWAEMELDTFTYSEDMKLEETDVVDGLYAIMFYTTDMVGNGVYSEYGYIEYKNGEIDTYTEDEME